VAQELVGIIAGKLYAIWVLVWTLALRIECCMLGVWYAAMGTEVLDPMKGVAKPVKGYPDITFLHGPVNLANNI